MHMQADECIYLSAVLTLCLRRLVRTSSVTVISVHRCDSARRRVVFNSLLLTGPSCQRHPLPCLARPRRPYLLPPLQRVNWGDFVSSERTKLVDAWALLDQVRNCNVASVWCNEGHTCLRALRHAMLGPEECQQACTPYT